MAYLETMTTGSAQNNTDWGNKEYDQLLKVADQIGTSTERTI